MLVFSLRFIPVSQYKRKDGCPHIIVSLETEQTQLKTKILRSLCILSQQGTTSERRLIPRKNTSVIQITEEMVETQVYTS